MTNLPIRCLLIDDDADDHDFFKAAIDKLPEKIEVSTAFGCQEGTEQLHKNPLPDFIFLDLNMPITSGLECLAGIKKNVEFKDIPVYILTTSASEKEREQALALGALGFMTKPVSITMLSFMLERAISI